MNESVNKLHPDLKVINAPTSINIQNAFTFLEENYYLPQRFLIPVINGIKEKIDIDGLGRIKFKPEYIDKIYYIEHEEKKSMHFLGRYNNKNIIFDFEFKNVLPNQERGYIFVSTHPYFFYRMAICDNEKIMKRTEDYFTKYILDDFENNKDVYLNLDIKKNK